MTASEIKEIVKSTVSHITGLPLDSLTDSTSFNNTLEWDSIAQLRIMIELEAPLGVHWTLREMSELTSIPVICAAVEAKFAH